MLDRVPLARLPTPIERLDRLSAAIGVEVWAKRDDLTGTGASGNKIRKLEYLIAEARAAGADTLVTTGGVQSNHARATALAARRCGLDPVLLLRGAQPVRPEGNYLLDRLLGAEIHWITPEAYRTDRDARLAQIAEDLRRRGAVPYVIPMGGSNATGTLGYVAAAREVAAQHPERFDGVVCAVGSAGTLAGLAIGADLGPIYGVAVSEGAEALRDKTAALVDEVGRLASSGESPFGPIPTSPTSPTPPRAAPAPAAPEPTTPEPTTPEPHAPKEPRGPFGSDLARPAARWQIVEGYEGPGYGVATPEIWRTIATVARTEGVLLDPTYTGKAMHALLTEARAGRLRGRWLFWHTGGIYGLFDRGDEIP